jgi:hypothetical protein
MGMGQDDGVNVRGVKGERAVAFAGFSAPPVKHAAVKENGVSLMGKSVH